VNGKGQTIAIVELGGGYRTSDLEAYFPSLGLKTPKVTAVSVDGGQNKPGVDTNADGEVMLDIEVVGAVAPGAGIAVYFAPNTDQGFHDAVTQAVHDNVRKPSVVSISWGGPETGPPTEAWTAQAIDSMNAALQDAAAMGVTVTVAAGDNGSTDGVSDNNSHVDFPASSPFALACGGTRLVGTGSAIDAETVWNDGPNSATGGGVSGVFATPPYQAGVAIPSSTNPALANGRGVPDISGNADPQTGYICRVNGQQEVIGGTSAVAPLWAGLVALLNQAVGKPVGFLHPVLYTTLNTKGALRDVTNGNNGAYHAGPGWDPCTGLGSPDGAAITRALTGSAAQTVS
jgi:kumamolisin